MHQAGIILMNRKQLEALRRAIQMGRITPNDLLDVYYNYQSAWRGLARLSRKGLLKRSGKVEYEPTEFGKKIYELLRLD